MLLQLKIFDKDAEYQSILANSGFLLSSSSVNSLGFRHSKNHEGSIAEHHHKKHKNPKTGPRAYPMQKRAGIEVL